MSMTYVAITLDLRDEVGWAALPADAEAQLGAIIHATVARVGLTGDFAVSLVICDDTQMRRVNRRYRGIDKTTDVLSFPQADLPLLALPPQERWVARPPGDDSHSMPFDDTPAVEVALPASPAGAVVIPGEPIELGDVILSAPTVERQALASGHRAWWECCFLVAHGTLHLLGYDDYYEPGYYAMVAHQHAVLTALSIQP